MPVNCLKSRAHQHSRGYGWLKTWRLVTMDYKYSWSTMVHQSQYTVWHCSLLRQVYTNRSKFPLVIFSTPWIPVVHHMRFTSFVVPYALGINICTWVTMVPHKQSTSTSVPFMLVFYICPWVTMVPHVWSGSHTVHFMLVSYSYPCVTVVKYMCSTSRVVASVYPQYAMGSCSLLCAYRHRHSAILTGYPCVHVVHYEYSC